jgi:RimJ/RimL family protein N-acetyltransferase
MPELTPATPADVPSIMGLERGEGFDRLVGRWPADEHLSELAKPTSAYLMWRQGAEDLGFALLEDIHPEHGSVRLRRIAVKQPGHGVGSALLEAVLSHVFGALQLHRLDLMVLTHNERARRTYLRAGFVEEGVVRENYRLPDGAYGSMVLMSILRPEWEARRP